LYIYKQRDVNMKISRARSLAREREREDGKR